MTPFAATWKNRAINQAISSNKCSNAQDSTKAKEPLHITGKVATLALSATLATLSTLAPVTTSPAYAAAVDQAYRIHNRITGTPPTADTLQLMESLVENGQAENAAMIAMNNPAFCNVTLKNFAAKYTTFEGSPLTPLNDASALLIGLMRDGADFRQALMADLTYVGAEGVVTTPYEQTSNTHYDELVSELIDLCDPEQFVATAQSTLPDSPLQTADTAGYMSTRGAAEQFYEAGTNRAMYRAVSMNFMCRDMEALSDVSTPTSRIRTDVSRSPGGDSAVFLNSCSGCHGGLDALAGAFAYYHWDDSDEDNPRLEFTGGSVQPKYEGAEPSFPSGFKTTDDSWVNHWRNGTNRNLGWSENLPGTGNGAKALGEELANSQQFAACQVERVFEEVCFRKPTSLADNTAAAAIAADFIASDYNMKTVFAKTAVHCMGE